MRLSLETVASIQFVKTSLSSCGRQSLYVRHKPEDHDDVMARRHRGKKNRRGYEDPKKKALKEDDTTKSQQRKLLLNKGIKAALLAIGAFTEEQTDAIVNETQSNLPKDF